MARDLAPDDDDDDDDDETVTTRIRAVTYDGSTVFGRGQRPTRRHLDERVMRRELEVVRDELHACAS